MNWITQPILYNYSRKPMFFVNLYLSNKDENVHRFSVREQARDRERQRETERERQRERDREKEGER